jgi:uncharacterized protein YndB with AHSA1/START domain
MQIVNTIFILRARSDVWNFLINPENMPSWNPKVTYVSPSVFADFKLGFHYTITYRMHGKAVATTFKAEFTGFEPPIKLVIRLTEQIPSVANRVIEERYSLAERDGGTFLTQTIHVENSGINVFFRALIWVIQKWGKPTGKPYLAELRDLIEG